ncbi:hypothetical protein BDZ97DRAFT_1782226 [Flammula alnicola]|nr:hypothetical protein BDZ97DRAFT_1782226 [Flammula alnicola]
MPGVTSAHSDSEDSNKAASKSKGMPDPVKGDPESGSEEEGDGGSEYEIEEVLDAKRGYFPDGRMGYFVKWKGYDHSEDSWVDELDAGNAEDLVKEFWNKHPQKKKAGGRKSMDKKSPKKPRKSAPPEDSSEAGNMSTKKRGRKSSTKQVESEDEMDVDEVTEVRAPKKARKSLTQTSKAKPRTETPEEEEKVIGNMGEYMHMKDWEGLVKSVDTVERQDDKLVVFFTLTTNEAVMETSDVCKDRFPRKLIDFYEANLRWRAVDDSL